LFVEGFTNPIMENHEKTPAVHEMRLFKSSSEIEKMMREKSP